MSSAMSVLVPWPLLHRSLDSDAPCPQAEESSFHHVLLQYFRTVLFPNVHVWTVPCRLPRACGYIYPARTGISSSSSSSSSQRFLGSACCWCRRAWGRRMSVPWLVRTYGLDRCRESLCSGPSLTLIIGCKGFTQALCFVLFELQLLACHAICQYPRRPAGMTEGRMGSFARARVGDAHSRLESWKRMLRSSVPCHAVPAGIWRV